MMRRLTRTAGWAALAAAFLLGLLACIRIVEIRIPIAPYETDYLKNDPPAYHLTPVKRMVQYLSERNGVTLSIIYQRRVVAGFRLLALAALLGLAVLHLGRGTGVAAFVIFMSLPPTFIYFVRVDPWMDAVCFAVISLYFLWPGRYPLLKCLAAGIFLALAVDSKTTVCLTIIPAALMLLRARSGKDCIIFLAGAAAGFVIAQPDWGLDPSKAVDHVEYWRLANAALPALDVGYPITALLSVIPASIICLSAIGLLEFKRNKIIQGAAVLGVLPVMFFLVYRTFNPDGVRHLYLVLPFLAALAAAGLNRLRMPAMLAFIGLWIAEMAWRFG